MAKKKDTSVNTQRIKSADKGEKLHRKDLVDDQSMADYKLVYGGRLDYKEKFDGSCWQIKVGANVIEEYPTKEAGHDRYFYLLENKIAVAMIMGDAYKRENIGGFAGAGAYSGWTRT